MFLTLPCLIEKHSKPIDYRRGSQIDKPTHLDFVLTLALKSKGVNRTQRIPFNILWRHDFHTFYKGKIVAPAIPLPPLHAPPPPPQHTHTLLSLSLSILNTIGLLTVEALSK